MADNESIDTLLTTHGIKCYERGRDWMAFDFDGVFHCVTSEELAPFLANGKSANALAGEAAQARVRGLRTSRPTGNAPPADIRDGLYSTRQRWLKEKASGQWAASFITGQLAELRALAKQREAELALVKGEAKLTALP